VAALAVAFYHVPWVNPTYYLGVVRNSYLMVDFFFVLSGFVICHGYRESLRSGQDLCRYAWLRFGRLYPLHLAVLLVWLSLDVVVFAKQVVTGDVGAVPAFSSVHYHELWTSLLLIQGLGTNSDLVYNYPSWSISTEFYTCLLFGVVVLLLRHRRPLWQVAAVISILSLVTYLLSGEQSFRHAFHFAFFRCVLGFFFGVVTYQAYLSLKPTFDRIGGGSPFNWAVSLTLGGTIAFLGVKTIGPSDFAITPLVGLVVLLVAGAQGGVAVRVLAWKPFAWLGRVSYSIYMVHAFVLVVANEVLRRLLKILPQMDLGRELGAGQLHPRAALGTALLVVTIGVVCLASHVTYTFVEDPFRKKSKQLADRWFGARDRTIR